MLKKRAIFILSIAFLIISCAKKTKYSYHLEKDNQAEFKVLLDSLTPPDTRMMQFFEPIATGKSQPAFAMLNFEAQYINFYNSKGKKLSELSLFTGDSTSYKITGFYFINADSLLTYSYKGREVKLVSCSNKFAPRLLFNLDSIDNAAISRLDVEVTSSTPMLYKNGVVYLTGRAMVTDISDPNSKAVNTAVSFDLNTNKLNFIPTFEQVWKERYWHHEQNYINHAFVPKQDRIVYSLQMKDSVILYNIKNRNQEKVSITSDELGDENDMIPEKIKDLSTLGSHDDLKKFLDKPRYGEIIFDKYRNVYYRFISAGDLKRVGYVIICDSNFKKIGETKLPENYLAGAGHFLTKEGLFLRDCSIQNENKIIYNLFKLSKTS